MHASDHETVHLLRANGIAHFFDHAVLHVRDGGVGNIPRLFSSADPSAQFLLGVGLHRIVVLLHLVLRLAGMSNSCPRFVFVLRPRS